LPDTPEQSIIVDVWSVADGGQDAFMETLVDLFERLRGLDGFIEGQILQGVDPTLFVSYATLRSARDLDEAFMDPDIRAKMRLIGGVARPNPHSYRAVRTFTPAAPAQSA
jgi:hypothetical protein